MNPSGIALQRTAVIAPLGLYVHWPWCVRKCPYCDFNSHPVRGSIPEAAYQRALLRDLDHALAHEADRPVHSVFFGGGTPSLASAAAVGGVLEALARRPGLEAGAEITLEANPGAAEAARFRAYRAAGVNRLSLGVQSLRDAALSRLGRIHGAAEARAAFAAARAAGFDNINVDLMYALPGDDVRAGLADLDGALALAPEHLSWYQLTIEPGTAFHRRPPALPDDDTVAAIEAAAYARLDGAGFTRYEVSAWARPGRRCRHNLNYWTFGDYLGIGAGAHGKFTRAAPFALVRTVRPREPRRYLAAAGTGAGVQRETVGAPQRRVEEFLLNALRLVEGVEVAVFEARTGLPRACLDQALARARQRGLVRIASGRVRPTATGLRFLNEILTDPAPAGAPDLVS